MWVIFDNDGVLVDSEPLANEVVAELLTAEGWPLTADECVERFLGTTMARVQRLAEAHLGRPLAPGFQAAYEQRLLERFRSELRPVPGVAAVVARVVPRCSVASSGSRARIRRSLELTGLAGAFGDRVVSAEDVAQGKPAPDLFLLAARRAGVSPGACVVIEDSPAGVAAARAAGMACLAYAGFTPPDRLAEADAVFQSMAELPGLLGLASPAETGGRGNGPVAPRGTGSAPTDR